MGFSRFVIVTGLSGAGKSQVMKSFEDLGFYCLDNLPPQLTGPVVDLAEAAHTERIALAPDVRTLGPFGDMLSALDALRERNIPYELLFLDASDEVLVRRYSETRRRHPFGGARHLTDAIAAERSALSELRDRADRVWDTSTLNQASLKAKVAETFHDRRSESRLAVALIAFGFKYGIPLDADLVFDVRFLPNPNYIAELKPLTGADRPVEEFMEKLSAAQQFLDRLYGMIDFLLPLYAAEGKSHLTIAIGCTGGRHRSVYIARRLLAHLQGRSDIGLTFEMRDAMRHA